MIKESRVEMTGNVFKIRKRTPSFAQNAWLCLAVVSPRKGIFKLSFSLEKKNKLIIVNNYSPCQIAVIVCAVVNLSG